MEAHTSVLWGRAFSLHVMYVGLTLGCVWPWPPLRASLMQMYHAVFINFILMEMWGFQDWGY